MLTHEPRFTLGATLGEGTHGVVYKAVDSKHATTVAVKRMRPKRGGEGVSITAYREIALVGSLHHPNLAKMLDVVTTYDGGAEDAVSKPALNLVFELCGSDLHQRIREKKEAAKAFRPLEIATLMRQLFAALAHLHSKAIVHRDIKPANLLVDDDLNLKVTDFGLARRLEPSPLRELHLDGEVVTLWYRSPELLLGAKAYGMPIDMWAAGCVLGELCALRPLFPGDDEMREAKAKEAAAAAGNDNPPPKRQPGVPDGLRRDQLFRIMKILGPPSRAEWPGLASLRYWPVVERWLETVDLGTALSPMSRRVSLRDFVDGGGAAEQSCCPSLILDLLSYDPEKRPTAQAAMEEAERMEETYGEACDDEPAKKRQR